MIVTDLKIERRQTKARRPRHVRGFLARWLAQLEVGFISRGVSGMVGGLQRSTPCRLTRRSVAHRNNGHHF